MITRFPIKMYTRGNQSIKHWYDFRNKGFCNLEDFKIRAGISMFLQQTVPHVRLYLTCVDHFPRSRRVMMVPGLVMGTLITSCLSEVNTEFGSTTANCWIWGLTARGTETINHNNIMCTCCIRRKRLCCVDGRYILSWTSFLCNVYLSADRRPIINPWAKACSWLVLTDKN